MEDQQTDIPRVRRRINRTISTKGIIQYEGTVETTGMSFEETMAEWELLESELNRLQPLYEEFASPISNES